MDICVDFDGTIVDYRFPQIGKPAPGAFAWLKRWQELGARIILFTMRSDGGTGGDLLTQAVEFISAHGIELYGINHNPDQDDWTQSPKAFGHLYIDDAAFGCPLTHPRGFSRPCVDWAAIGPEVASILLAAQNR